ncbi:MAG: mechanosensitive ion channel domain-containing protein, partial [bacterium]
YQPFTNGDSISVLGYEGKVVDINLRYTVLDKDEEKILIPNSKLFTSPLKLARIEKKKPPTQNDQEQ